MLTFNHLLSAKNLLLGIGAWVLFNSSEPIFELKSVNPSDLIPKNDSVISLRLSPSVDVPIVLNWTKLKDAHIKRKEAHSIVVDNKFYVVGGFYDYINNLKITNTMEVYNPSNNIWTYLKSSLRAVSHASIALDELSNGQKELWLIGGFEGNNPGIAINKVQIYNINTNTWRYGSDLPETMSAHSNAQLDRKIHIFGGLFADRNTNKNAHYFMDLDNQAAGWQIASPMPQPRNHFAAVSFQGKIYALGGQLQHDNNNQDVNYAHVYDPYLNSWKKLANLPITRSHFEHSVCVTSNEKIITIGGRTATNIMLDNVSEYNPILDTWSELGKLPGKKETPNSTIINNLLYTAFGGSNGITPTNALYSTSFVRSLSNKMGFQSNTIQLNIVQNKITKKNIYLWTSNGTPNYTIKSDNLPNWLSVSNLTGITSSQSKEIKLTFNSTNLAVGTYQYTLLASANGYSDAKINITLNVSEENNDFTPVVLLNAGGLQVVFDDKTFTSDAHYPSYYNSLHTYTNINLTGVSELYQTERGSATALGNLTYNIPVPNGTYRLITHHAELWYGFGGRPTGANKRVFDILIEGRLKKDNFDMYKEGLGANPAQKTIVLSFDGIVVTDGFLTLNMKASVNRPSISGLEIYASNLITSSITQNKDTANELILFPNPVKDELFIQHKLAEDKQMKITLYDGLGRIVLVDMISSSTDKLIKLNVQNLKSGVYQLNIGDKKFSKSYKIIKE